jgi:hypothetical protein
MKRSHRGKKKDKNVIAAVILVAWVEVKAGDLGQ